VLLVVHCTRGSARSRTCRFEAEEIRDVGRGVVFAHLVQRASPRGSPASIEFRFATVTVWIDGLIHQVWVYLSADAARRAAVQLTEERS
jgi:hypothetical protein